MRPLHDGCLSARRSRAVRRPTTTRTMTSSTRSPPHSPTGPCSHRSPRRGGGAPRSRHDAVELQRFAAEHGAPTGWTEAEVAVFFNEIGLGRYQRQLAKNAVDGATLCDIVASGGLRDLGVANIVASAAAAEGRASAGARGGACAGATVRLPPGPPPPPRPSSAPPRQQALAQTAPVATLSANAPRRAFRSPKIRNSGDEIGILAMLQHKNFTEIFFEIQSQMANFLRT